MSRTLTHNDIERIMRDTEKRCDDGCTTTHKTQGDTVAGHIVKALIPFIGTRPVTDIVFTVDTVGDVITVSVLNGDVEYLSLAIPASEVWCYTHCTYQLALWANRRKYEFTPIIVHG